MLNFYLFDDQKAQDWCPFTLTRPAGELTLGCMSMRERGELFWGGQCLGYITSQSLHHFDEPETPSVIETGDIASDEPLILFLSRAVPDLSDHDSAIISRLHLDTSPKTLLMDGETVGWFLPRGFSGPENLDLLNPSHSPKAFPVLQLSGSVLHDLWDLVLENGKQIGRDLNAMSFSQPEAELLLPDRVTCLGDHLISIQEDVSIDPRVHLDSTLGPIFISPGVRIRAFTHIAGPVFIGPGTHLLGGYMKSFTAGSGCKLRGEISNSVIMDYTNKAHDGYLGNSYLGSWVNLGAFTTNSDLKNNYGEIKVSTPKGLVNTGNQKLGIFVGDHVKTGIGSLLPAGCVIGCGTNIFGGGMSPSEIPAFSWGTCDKLGEYELPAFLEMTNKVMSRRGLSLTSKAEQLLITAWDDTHLQRIAKVNPSLQ